MGMESVRMFHSTLNDAFLPPLSVCISSLPGYLNFFFLRHRLKTVIFHSLPVRSIFDATVSIPCLDRQPASIS